MTPVKPGVVELRLIGFDVLGKVRMPKTPGAGPLRIPVALREDATAFVRDYLTVPHQLTLGATISGKSMYLRNLIKGLARQPVALVGIDCKRGVELAPFAPRLSALATDPDEAAELLPTLVKEMEDRYDLIKARQGIAPDIPDEEITSDIWGLPEYERPVPIVLFVDEVAELFLTATRKDETAVDDELIRRNPCRIKGAGKESSAERQIATVAQVDALADAVGPRWRLMVFLGAYGPMRPEEQAELRRKDVDLEAMTIRVRQAAPELTTGKRALGDTKSEVGKRIVVLPAFLRTDLRRHLDWYAEKDKGAEGLLFVGEKGKPFRRSSFGRKWRKARERIGMPEGFRFYDLRHTGHTLSTRSGATLKDTMVRAGQSSTRAALFYQHSDVERQQEVAGGLDDLVRAERKKGTKAGAAQADDGPSGADLVRDA
ncbi:FtsK/SpoIIIE domain-containing protein [Streptomyces sp. NPDC042319]|uniref:FtsK/SpoIIIE domain-containing protein n=1 Tax=Streptomyces sp. NPDC042319 TaxID=3154332 RepID=UPI0033CC715E